MKLKLKIKLLIFSNKKTDPASHTIESQIKLKRSQISKFTKNEKVLRMCQLV